MEKVNHVKVMEAVYPSLLRKLLSDEELNAVLAASGEGYSFPTNLDTDPPLGSLVPKTQQQLFEGYNNVVRFCPATRKSRE